MDDLESRYQLPDDIAAAGTVLVENELIDYFTGVPLVDGETNETLTAETPETVVSAAAGNCTPIVLTNDEDFPALINITNRKTSEVEVTLLGYPRSETALALFDSVNIYGVNRKEWASSDETFYTYNQDPGDWTDRNDPSGVFYGATSVSHLAAESALSARVYCPPVSFTYPFDDNSGRYPGGYTNGVATAFWESKRAFRYQPGRVTGFTLGVRMSTESGYAGEVIEWGCRNTYGDKYFFRLTSGNTITINRTSPALGSLEVPRNEWNGDPLLLNEGTTGWGLDLSRVTMFKIEFSWYGAVGAQFLAYVPAGSGDGRWVRLHTISAENRFETPSLRSAYLRLYISVRSTAGATTPAFINLYGSSVYIDGGDKGTVITGAATMESPKVVSSTARSILGLQVKGTINGVNNQKAVYPVSFAAFASVPTRFDLILKRANLCGGVQYGYGPGTAITKANSTSYSGSKTGSTQFTIAAGTFPDISSELTGETNYLSGRRVRVTGTNVFSTHVVSINGSRTVITTDRELPAGLTSIRLSRLDGYAVGSGATIASGVTQGSIYRTNNAGYWRIGLWPQAAGSYDGTQSVLWVASSYSTLNFDRFGNVTGERRTPAGCNTATSFAVAINSGTTSYTLSAGDRSLTVAGSTNPWPIAVVAELMDGANISDLTIFEGNNINVMGSGTVKALTTFTLTNLTGSSAPGGDNYIAHKFEDSDASPLSAVMVDRQGLKFIEPDTKVATYFIGSGETKQFDLSNLFGPDKMFITGAPGSDFNTGGLFVMATARTGSGVTSAMLNWEEQ